MGRVMEMIEMSIRLITWVRAPEMVLEREDRKLQAREGNVVPVMVPARAGGRALRMVITVTGSNLFPHLDRFFYKY